MLPRHCSTDTREVRKARLRNFTTYLYVWGKNGMKTYVKFIWRVHTRLAHTLSTIDQTFKIYDPPLCHQSNVVVVLLSFSDSTPTEQKVNVWKCVSVMRYRCHNLFFAEPLYWEKAATSAFFLCLGSSRLVHYHRPAATCLEMPTNAIVLKPPKWSDEAMHTAADKDTSEYDPWNPIAMETWTWPLVILIRKA